MSVRRFPECANCSFHDVEPVICEQCKNGSEFLNKTYEVDPTRHFQFFEDRDIE